MSKIFKNKKNTVALFSGLNQGTKEYTMWCTIFFSFTNAYYNWALKRIPTYEDIIKVWNKQKELWLLDDKKWAYLINSAKAVAKYIWCDLFVCKKWSKDFDTFLEAWFMIWVWISVNKEFYDDYKDWQIEKYQDYIKYQWEHFQHALNLYKWKDRFWEKGKDYNNEKLYDNYMSSDKNRVNSIDVNIEEMKDVMYSTCYILI